MISPNIMKTIFTPIPGTNMIQKTAKIVQIVFTHSVRIFKAQETCVPAQPNEWRDVTADVDFGVAIKFKKPRFPSCIVPWHLIERIDIDENCQPWSEPAKK